VKVVVDGKTATVNLTEPDVLNSLAVEFVGCTPEGAADILGKFGRLDGQHAWLTIDTLRRANPSADGEWESKFDQAMQYAAQHGWTDEAMTCVRAHIVPADASS
jgi:hypothetical protein